MTNDPTPDAPPRRARSRRRISHGMPSPLRPATRVAIFVAGVVLLLVGAVMLVTPGPGIVALIAGLGLLAAEFRWARGWYLRAKRSALRAKRLGERKLRQRRERRAAEAWEREHGARGGGE